MGQPRACFRSKAPALAGSSKFTLSVSPFLSWASHNACHGLQGSIGGMPVSATDLKAPGDKGVSFVIPAVTPVPSTVRSRRGTPSTAEARDMHLSEE